VNANLALSLNAEAEFQVNPPTAADMNPATMSAEEDRHVGWMAWRYYRRLCAKAAAERKKNNAA
jgi:hypothetical protein